MPPKGQQPPIPPGVLLGQQPKLNVPQQVEQKIGNNLDRVVTKMLRDFKVKSKDPISLLKEGVVVSIMDMGEGKFKVVLGRVVATKDIIASAEVEIEEKEPEVIGEF